MNLLQMLDFDEATVHLTMVSSVCWYRHVLRREFGHVLRIALEFAVEGQRKKKTGKKKKMLGGNLCLSCVQCWCLLSSDAA